MRNLALKKGCVFRANVTADFAESVTGVSRDRDRDFALIVTEAEKQDVWIEGLASPLYFEVSEHAPGATIHAQDPRCIALPPHHRPEPRCDCRCAQVIQRRGRQVPRPGRRRSQLPILRLRTAAHIR